MISQWFFLKGFHICAVLVFFPHWIGIQLQYMIAISPLTTIPRTRYFYQSAEWASLLYSFHLFSSLESGHSPQLRKSSHLTAKIGREREKGNWTRSDLRFRVFGADVNDGLFEGICWAPLKSAYNSSLVSRGPWIASTGPRGSFSKPGKTEKNQQILTPINLTQMSPTWKKEEFVGSEFHSSVETFILTIIIIALDI